MSSQHFFAAFIGYAAVLGACAADSSQSARIEGMQQVMQDVRTTFDELARPAGACVGARLGNDKSCESEATWKQLLVDACEARGMILDSVALGDRCEEGKLSSVSFSCCPKSGPAAAPNCTSSVLGGPTSCRSTATWKESLIAACEAEGRLLTDAFFGESCGADSVRSVSYECCGAQAAPPPPNDCQSASASGVCRTPEDWKSTVSAECSGRGLVLSDLALSDACETGKFSTTRYLCCGARSTPPPAPACQSTVYGTSSCRSEADWKQIATDLCAGQGLTLEAIAYTDACDSGVWRNMKYACCPKVSTPPPDPPPASSCTTQILGDGSVCSDQATWRDQAVRTCAAASQRLSALSFGTECGTGKYTLAKVECCK